MHAFIVRPFGTKNDINFDQVERDLIGPALDRLGIAGRTTAEILEQGNIRIDMFQRLLTADLVIADLSIHNANVFYELGIRHALRDKRTFLIRCSADEIPFDLKTDRYFSYPRENPSESLELLTSALRRTLDSEDRDSPVFQLLPNLRVQDRSRFLVVPLDFREEVERAEAAKERGDLEMLAAETQGFEWESEGLRIVGRAQLELKALEGARTTWELVRNFDSNDREANSQLATIYQRLNDLPRSDQALKRVLDREDLAKAERAEARTLLGRNAKTRWRAEWRQLPPEQRRRQALRSGFLDECLEDYLSAFGEDLNHFYSGLNALALLTVKAELAGALPEVWEEGFDSSEEAQQELAKLNERIRKLGAVVELSLQGAADRLEREGKEDLWTDAGLADLVCLTSKKPARVAAAYRKALVEASEFDRDAIRSQLLIYQQLGVLLTNVQAALEVVDGSTLAADLQDQAADEVPKRVLVFTGHRLDREGREKLRFPPEAEPIARQAIRDAVAQELKLAQNSACGIAGGASGGDILFHEVCAEFGIPTRLYLAVPRDQYIISSVQAAGPQWVERFNALYDSLRVRVLAESKQLPRWLRQKPSYTVWQRNNLWILHNAIANGASNVALIALWNGEAGDGPGGTEDMVRRAQERGAKTIILDTNKLFNLNPRPKSACTDR